MRVFLIHGMGRTPVSMWLLARRLKRAGYRPNLFGYAVTLADLEAIKGRFVEKVHAVLAAAGVPADGEAERYAIIGHSLGNLVARLASPELPAGLCRFAMLAPPNHPPVMAHTLKGNPLFRAFTRDAGRRLADDAFFDSLPVPGVPSLIVAGTAGPRASWLPFAGQPNDGILKVDETRLAGVPMLEVPGFHTFLMNRADVFAVISEFFSDAVC
ncbi:MAG: alpha/beta fold hydrolase [bacterium]|nr:alpha/beta fold hydrolase [bacterium]